MSTTTEKPRYRSPVAYVEAEVSLSEFTTADLESELDHRRGGDGCSAWSHGTLSMSGEDLARLHTLALCGQRDEAREFLFDTLHRQTGIRLN